MAEEDREDRAAATMVDGFHVDELRAMLVREDELRRSEEVQLAYAEAERSEGSSWMVVTQELQRRVVAEGGYSAGHPRALEALYALRRAGLVCAELASIPLYVKYNRCRPCDLRCGEPAPDIELRTLDGRTVRALNCCLSTCRHSLICVR